MLSDLISTHCLDIFLMTETWLKHGDNNAFSELLQPGYSYLSAPLMTGHGVSLAAVFRDKLTCCLLPPKHHSSFKLQVFVRVR